MNLNSERPQQTAAMLQRTAATKEDFEVTAPDGAVLRGWKVRPANASGNWVLLFHGVSDNRTGMLGAAEVLLHHHYCVVMMDSRAHGRSDGQIATYGWLERRDVVAITNALYASEQIGHLYALGTSMGAAVALQSAAVEPRIEAVVAEAPFASLREVSYDYAGMDVSPWLGRTILRPASIVGMRRAGKAGNFDPDEVSPEKAVTARAFPVLLFCGSLDRRIPCRHSMQICRAARGPCTIWTAVGAGHAAVLGTDPQEYEARITDFLERH